MKKFAVFLIAMMMMAANCYAMTFSQPQKIGAVYAPPGGYSIENATYSDGKIRKDGNNILYDNLYEKNFMAKFGNENGELYFYHKPNNFDYFGGKDKNFLVNIIEAVEIYKIDNNKDFSLFILQSDGNDIAARNYIFIGKTKNGEWTKYLDVYNLKIKYFGNDRHNYLQNFYCKNNTVIVDVVNGGKKVGEFRFKWDDAAQWFGVEKITY